MAIDTPDHIVSGIVRDIQSIGFQCSLVNDTEPDGTEVVRFTVGATKDDEANIREVVNGYCMPSNIRTMFLPSKPRTAQ